MLRHGIRANLPANREARRRSKARVGHEAFGIYHRLTPGSESQLRAVVEAFKPDAEQHLASAREKTAELVIPPCFATTYLPRRMCRAAMRRGLLHRGFQYHVMLELAEEQGLTSYREVDVPLDMPDWYSGNRKLACRFTPTEPLTEQQGNLKTVLSGANADCLNIADPNHTTVIDYGTNGDGQDLSWEHRDDLVYMLHEKLTKAGITSLTFGELVFGDSYDQPKQLAA